MYESRGTDNASDKEPSEGRRPSDNAEPEITVESILNLEKKAEGIPLCWVVGYEDRPLQALPPDGKGPHLLFFTNKELASAFIEERKSYFGPEPLSATPLSKSNALRQLLTSPSNDTRYEGPPCGALVDFSYDTRDADVSLSPQDVEAMDADELANSLGFLDREKEIGSLKQGQTDLDQTEKPARTKRPEPDQPDKEPALKREQSSPTTGKPGQRPRQEKEEPPQRRGIGAYHYILGVGCLVLVLLVGATAGLVVIETAGGLRSFQARLAGLLSRPTQTPVPPTITAVPSATAAPVISDNNRLLVVEEFNNPNSGWEEFSVDGYSAGYAAGEYSISVADAESISFGVYPLTLADAEIEAIARQESGPDNGNTAYGIMCRIQRNYDGYLFLVSGDGYFSIVSSVQGEFTALVDWTESAAIEAAPQENDIRATCIDDQLTLSVNGEPLSEVRDSTFSSGEIGLVGTSFEEHSAELRFDNVRISSPVPQERDTKICLVTDIGLLNDRSFNAAAWRGLLRAEAELGVQSDVLESRVAEDYASNIANHIESGCDLIVTSGFLLADATLAAAEQNPEMNFAILDFALEELPNRLLGQVFAVDQAGFLAGYLAAGVTETGAVATFGGLQIPPITAYMDGFVLGVQHYNQVHGTQVDALGWDPVAQAGLFAGNFESREDGRRLAEALLDEGADIIFPVAGPVGLGAAEAVQDHGSGFIIGMDNDWRFSAPQYEGIVLTSAVKRLDTAVLDASRMLVEGEFTGGVYVGTLANGGVDISPFGNAMGAVPDSLMEELDQVRQQIIQGQISTSP